jgi:hypothetical protein
MYHIGLGAMNYFEDGDEWKWGFTLFLHPKEKHYLREKDARKRVDELKVAIGKEYLIEVRDELNMTV